MHPTLRILGWSYVALCALIVARAATRPELPSAVVTHSPPRHSPPGPSSADAAEWFRRVKPYCNSVEITVVQRQSPPPANTAGVGYHAACYALAGKID